VPLTNYEEISSSDSDADYLREANLNESESDYTLSEYQLKRGTTQNLHEMLQF
jgi:hypothetical protein